MGLCDVHIAIVGVSGQVGQALLDVLRAEGVPACHICGFASQRTNRMPYGDEDVVPVEPLGMEVAWSRFHIVFMAAGRDISARFAPHMLKAGCFIVDKSSFFRMHDDIPLVVPEVNGYLIPLSGAALVSTPNCVALPLMVVVHALQFYGGMEVKTASIATYQSVSGAGRLGVESLKRQMKQACSNIVPCADQGPFTKPIAFNVMAQIGSVDHKSECTDEEQKVMEELHKVLHVKACVTCVRVPVWVGHCMAVHLVCANAVDVADVRQAFAKEPSIVLDEPGCATTPLECAGKEKIYVGRIRGDGLSPNGLMLWVACDNLLKGSALNAVQIASYRYQESSSYGSFSVGL